MSEQNSNFSKERWAWQFLRRNPEYQRDYDQFISRWRSLEKDYGAAPNRDFHKWKNDPRAFVNEYDPELNCEAGVTDSCSIDNKIMIECWMGAKWGFYKFPLNPDYESPKVPDELLWRDQIIDLDDNVLDEELESDRSPVISLNFDLRLSLKDQLNAARKELIGFQRHIKNSKQNKQVKLTVSDYADEWALYLRILDNPEEYKKASNYQCKQAELLCTSAYLRILLMRD